MGPDWREQRASRALVVLARCSVRGAVALMTALANKALAADYSVYRTWTDMDQATGAKYLTAHRISGTNGYTGFWFFGAEQFDASSRYALAMTV